MSRPIVLGVVALLLFAFGVIAANTRIVQGVIPVTPYEADVNKDGRVNVADLGNVASRYGKPVPTATATPTSYCNLSGRDLRGALTGAPTLLGTPSFADCLFIEAQLGGGALMIAQSVNFQRSDFSGAQFLGGSMPGNDFAHARFVGVTTANLDFGGSVFTNADFSNSRIDYSRFSYADLSGTRFTNAVFTNPLFDSANLSGASTTGAIVTNATWNNTTCPDGTNSDNNGGSCIGHGFAGTPLPTYTPTATPTATATPDTCIGASVNARWTAGNGHCYLLFQTGRSWTAAKSDCESIGAYLVTMGSADENAFVVAVFGGGDRWIGFTDAVVEGQWEWVTGEPVAYTNWGGGEPNDGGGSYPYEDGALVQSNGYWNDGYDGFNLFYVCERDN